MANRPLSYLNVSGIADELKAFAESAMAEYDFRGDWPVCHVRPKSCAVGSSAR